MPVTLILQNKSHKDWVKSWIPLVNWIPVLKVLTSNSEAWGIYPDSVILMEIQSMLSRVFGWPICKIKFRMSKLWKVWRLISASSYLLFEGRHGAAFIHFQPAFSFLKSAGVRVASLDEISYITKAPAWLQGKGWVIWYKDARPVSRTFSYPYHLHLLHKQHCL